MVSYYDILGVSQEASEAEVRKAYRRLARKCHPDLNPGDKDPAARFKEVNEAYQVLSDQEKRSRYDRYGDNWKNADRIEEAQRVRPSAWGGSVFAETSFEDMFANFFSDRGVGISRTTLQHKVEVTLEEASQGTTRLVEVSTAGQSPGRRLTVKIPPGVDNSSTVHVAFGNGRRGDLYLRVSVRPHNNFQREADNLKTTVKVPLVDAILGSEVMVSTLQGKVALKIPAETQNGHTFRLKGKGMPRLQSPQNYGDLLVKVRVALLKNLTDEERQLFEQLRALRPLDRRQIS
jgi:DnaJ-class molecular chaperone